MDRLQQVLKTIKKNLGGMNPSQKLLIGTLAIIMVMTLFLVSQYAAKPNYVAVWPGAPAEDQSRAIKFLTEAKIKVVNLNGTAVVAQEKRDGAIASLQQGGQQPTNSAVVFENILKTQNWINSKEQNRQIYKVMLDSWLAGVLANFESVESAKVFVDAPEQVGFGASAKVPKASVAIFCKPGKSMDQAGVDAAVRLVAGSVSGLEVDRVNISVDGRPRQVRKEGDLSVSVNQDSARSIERQFEQKLANVLQYIDGVVVAVTATVDTNRMRAQVVKNLPMGEGSVSTPSKELVSSTTEAAPSSAAQPGPQSNVRADINAGGSSGSRSEQKQEDTQYTTAIGTEKRETESAGGVPTRLVATVTVPRGYIVGLIKSEAPAPAAASGTGGTPPPAPTPAEVSARFEKEGAEIEKILEPHFKTVGLDGKDVQGEVGVMLVSSDAPAGGGGGRGGGGSGNGSTGGSGALNTLWAASGLLDKALPAILAVVAMAMMFMLVRKAGKRVDLPTAEELVGLPPTLEAKSDLVGEADESEAALAGIEVGDDEIKLTKMRESVGEFIKQNPEGASKLLNRWISVEP